MRYKKKDIQWCGRGRYLKDLSLDPEIIFTGSNWTHWIGPVCSAKDFKQERDSVSHT